MGKGEGAMGGYQGEILDGWMGAYKKGNAEGKPRWALGCFV